MRIESYASEHIVLSVIVFRVVDFSDAVSWLGVFFISIRHRHSVLILSNECIPISNDFVKVDIKIRTRDLAKAFCHDLSVFDEGHVSIIIEDESIVLDLKLVLGHDGESDKIIDHIIVVLWDELKYMLKH